MSKPADVFDRAREWSDLEGFVDSPAPGAALGLVYGRRRQGKTFLLEALSEQRRGLYFGALRASAEQNLRQLAERYRAFTAGPAPIRFETWHEALTALLALGQGGSEPVLIVVDEFPYLVDSAAEIPSVLQDLLRPRSSASQGRRARLILCGSALSTMRSLLVGSAPLRGRASLELMLHPFAFRDAARFWGLDEAPDTALRLHALLGGTPAYLDMSGARRPAPDAFDAWVVDTLLNPASAMFREPNVVLAEDLASTSTPFFAVLAAISSGATRRGQIAAATGRPATALAHQLAVLEQARLIRAVPDALRLKRTSYQIAEPILRFGQLITTPNEARLSRHHAQAVWDRSRDTVSSKIYGPHFESLARDWCLDHAAEATLGGPADTVGPTQIPCREHRVTHEIDVVVVSTPPQSTNRITAIGEAKWQTAPPNRAQVRRLDHLRTLLGAADARLLLFSRTPFGDELTQEASTRGDLELVDLDRLYHGQ